MNYDQLFGIARTILTAAVAYAAGKGLIPSGVVPADLVAAVMTIVVTLWSVFSKTNAATVKKAAAIVPISDATQRSVGVDNPVQPPSR